MIIFQNITKAYSPASCALQKVNLRIEKGEFVSIVGQSGAGKSTLVKILIAEERPTEGKIIVGGKDITNIRHDEIPFLRRKIGVVFQDFKLLPRKTIFENTAFALEVCGYSNKKIKVIVPQVLKIVGLGDKQDRFPKQLSGGEQQRAVIARALVYQPEILVADEPTGNLDTINSREIVDILKKINLLGTTVLLLSHDREIVNHLRKRVITLDKGVVISDKQNSLYLI
ncbi:MAG: cell division transport system ATP-binding protein [Parcubacteria group bacterium Athens1014_10]|nr:MAG: cell division transport system ATP-binding protein [Parcubacteria group bacterium Athens1014_10]TSD06047.1 MAG: cell division transport system ATP-binding protein [Parcubacteria group bacterium Athens0714_12]